MSPTARRCSRRRTRRGRHRRQGDRRGPCRRHVRREWLPPGGVRSRQRLPLRARKQGGGRCGKRTSTDAFAGVVELAAACPRPRVADLCDRKGDMRALLVRASRPCRRRVHEGDRCSHRRRLARDRTGTRIENRRPGATYGLRRRQDFNAITACTVKSVERNAPAHAVFAVHMARPNHHMQHDASGSARTITAFAMSAAPHRLDAGGAPAHDGRLI